MWQPQVSFWDGRLCGSGGLLLGLLLLRVPTHLCCACWHDSRLVQVLNSSTIFLAKFSICSSCHHQVDDNVRQPLQPLDGKPNLCERQAAVHHHPCTVLPWPVMVAGESEAVPHWRFPNITVFLTLFKKPLIPLPHLRFEYLGCKLFLNNIKWFSAFFLILIFRRSSLTCLYVYFPKKYPVRQVFKYLIAHTHALQE